MEDSPPKELNEMEVSKVSDIEFKIMIIKMLKELTENYKELSGNYTSMKKEIEYQQEPGRNEEYNIWNKNSTRRKCKQADEAQHGISKLENKVERNMQVEQQNKKLQKHEDSLSELQDNMKHSNITS